MPYLYRKAFENSAEAELAAACFRKFYASRPSDFIDSFARSDENGPASYIVLATRYDADEFRAAVGYSYVGPIEQG